MKISKRNLSRLIESLLRESELEMSLKYRAFDEFDSLKKQQGVVSGLNNVLSNVGYDGNRPKIDLSNIFRDKKLELEIPLEKEEVVILDELIPELSEFIKTYLESDEEHITSYIKEITPVLGKGIKEWFKDGQLHREGDKPAVIWYRGDGSIRKEQWFKDGELYREGDKPASIWYRLDGSIYEERWYKDEKEHREGDKPAAISYYEDGSIEVERWFKDGERNREGDKPAEIEYRRDGSIWSEHWCKDGERNREGDKPASIWYRRDGSIEAERWFKDGEWHREGDKPAGIEYHKDGSIREERWFKDGVEYTLGEDL